MKMYESEFLISRSYSFFSIATFSCVCLLITSKKWIVNYLKAHIYSVTKIQNHVLRKSNETELWNFREIYQNIAFLTKRPQRWKMSKYFSIFLLEERWNYARSFFFTRICYNMQYTAFFLHLSQRHRSY